MEHKIGEIITLPDGRKAEVVEYGNSSCYGCVGVNVSTNLCRALGKCFYTDRADHKNIIYKEVK